MLYELFLRIEDMNHVYLITKQREKYLLTKEEGRFQVKKAAEPKKAIEDKEYIKSLYLEVPIIQSKPIVERYKLRKQNLLKKCKEESARRAQKVLNMSRKPKSMSPLEGFKESRHLRRRDKIEEFLSNSKLKDGDQQMPVISQDQISYLAQKKKETLANEKIKLRMFELILHDLWFDFLTQERNEFDKYFRNKLIEQSTQEHKLLQKLSKLHNNYKNFFQHRITIVDTVENLNQSDIVQIYSNEKKSAEKQRFLELHNRLFEEIANMFNKEAYLICQQTVRDLIDFAISKSEYRQMNEEVVSVDTLLQWKELFYKGIPIKFASGIEFTEKHEEVREAKVLGTEVIDVLVDSNVNCYLKLEGPWSVKDLDISEPDLSIFGYIIHRLLRTKYPFPPDPKPAVLPDFKIKAILGDLYDKFVFSQLRSLLENQSVVLIDVNLFTNHCLQVYEQEKSYSEFARSLKRSNSEFSMSPSTTPERMLPKTMSKEKKSKHRSPHMLRHKNKANKKTQFPPVLTRIRPIHTYAGLLGKVAFETLNTGNILNDVLLSSMLIEYLKTLEGKKGFILVGFPITHNQALILEYLIMGKPLHTNIREVHNDYNLFGVKVQYSLSQVNSSILLDFNNLLSKYIKRDEPFSQDRKLSLRSNLDTDSKTGEDDSVTGRKKQTIVDDQEVEASTKILMLRGHSRGTIKMSGHSRENLHIKHTSSQHIKDDSKPSTCDSILVYPKKSIPLEEILDLRTSKILPNPTADFLDDDTIDYTYIDKYFAIFKGYPYPLKNKMAAARDRRFSLAECKHGNNIVHKTEYLAKNIIPAEIVYGKLYKSTRIHVLDFDVETLNFLARTLLNETYNFTSRERKKSVQLFGKHALEEVKKKNTVKRQTGFIDEKIHFVPSPTYYECNDFDKNFDQRVSSIFMTKSPSPDFITNTKTFRELKSDNSLFLNEPVCEDIQVTLATIWECVEKSYLSCLRDSLTRCSILKSKLLTYQNYVKSTKEECLKKCDERMQIVNNFQLMFNAVDEFMRSDILFKYELHFRVNELKHVLTSLIISKHFDAQKTRAALLNEQWAINHICHMSTIYLQLLELEIYRCTDSLQIICDYYLTMLGSYPIDQVFQKTDIKLFNFDDEDTPSIRKKSRKTTQSQTRSIFSKSRSYSLKPDNVRIDDIIESAGQAKLQVTSGVNSVLKKVKSLENDVLDMIKNDTLGKGLKRAKNKIPSDNEPSTKGSINLSRGGESIRSMHSKSKSEISRTSQESVKDESIQEEEIIVKKTSEVKLPKAETAVKDDNTKVKTKKGKQKVTTKKEKATAKGDKGKATAKVEKGKVTTKRGKEKITTKQGKVATKQGKTRGSTGKPVKTKTAKSKMKPSRPLTQEEMQLVAMIKAEWEKVVQTEIDRLNFRIKLIETKGFNDIEIVLESFVSLFLKFEGETQELYERDMDAVENICNLFRSAIEDETPIQPLIVFDNDQFFIDKSNILFPNEPPDPPEALEELTTKYSFRVQELDRLVTMLINIAPNGIIILENFASVLHHLCQENKLNTIPVGWAHLTLENVKEILGEAYGQSVIIDWKDFIIFALNIPYPTIDDIMELKNAYEQIDKQKNEIITIEQFYNSTLWFEKEFADTLEEDLHLMLAKLLCQKIFQINNSEINYKQFLLAFCKGDSNKAGFLKVLQFLGGNKTLCGKECIFNKVVSIDAIVLAKQMVDVIFAQIFPVIDDVKLKTLPMDCYENIFASPSNEYIKTEQILIDHWLHSRRRKRSSVESLTDFQIQSDQDDEYKNLIPLDERYPDPMWHRCIHYKFALSILMLALNQYIISPNHININLEIEKHLKNLYTVKGIGNYIQAFHIYESDFMQNIMRKTSFFKMCKFDSLVEKICQRPPTATTVSTVTTGKTVKIK